MALLRKLAVVVSFLSLGLTAAAAGELTTDWAGKAPARSRLILEASEFSGSGASRAGVQIRLDNGWWTYWRAPGSSGMPPMFDWSGSENLADDPETTWPVPVRAVAYGESLNLYRNEVVFPVEFRAADPAKPVKLRVRVMYGVCRNMCVPMTAEHELVLKPAAKAPVPNKANAKLLAAYTGRGPSPDPFATGMEIREVRTSVANAQVVFSLQMTGLRSPRSVLLLVEAPGLLRAGEVKPKLSDDKKTATLALKVGSAAKLKALNGKRVRVTVIDGERALEQVWVVGSQGSSIAGAGLTPVSSNSTPEP